MPAKPKSNLVERTAKSPFELNGAPVRAGQIVPLNPLQLTRLAAAGCVALTDDDNAEVPVSDLTDLTPTPTVVLGDKGQTVELTDEEWTRLEGLDQRLISELRGRAVGTWTDDQWARLALLDAGFTDVLRARKAPVTA